MCAGLSKQFQSDLQKQTPTGTFSPESVSRPRRTKYGNNVSLSHAKTSLAGQGHGARIRYVLAGSVRKSRNRIRISAELVDARRATTLLG